MNNNDSQEIIDEIMTNLKPLQVITPVNKNIPTKNLNIRVKLYFPQYPDISIELQHKLKYPNIIDLNLISIYEVMAMNIWFESEFYDRGHVQLKHIIINNDATTCNDVIYDNVSIFRLSCNKNNFPIMLYDSIPLFNNNNYIRLIFDIQCRPSLQLQCNGSKI